MLVSVEEPRKKRGKSWSFSSPLKRKNTDDDFQSVPILVVLDFIEMGGFSLHDPNSYQVKWKQGRNQGKSRKIIPALGLINIDYYVQFHMNMEQQRSTETFTEKYITLYLKQHAQFPNRKVLLSSININLCNHLTFGSSTPSRIRIDFGIINGRQIEMFLEITTMLELSRSDIKHVIEQRRPIPIQLSQENIERHIKEFTLFESDSESEDLLTEEFYFRHGSFPQLFEELEDSIEEQNMLRKNSYIYNDYEMKIYQLRLLEDEILFLERQLEIAERKLRDFDRYLIHEYSLALLRSEIDNTRNVEALEAALALLRERDEQLAGLEKNSILIQFLNVCASKLLQFSCSSLVYIIFGIFIGLMGMIELQIRFHYFKD